MRALVVDDARVMRKLMTGVAQELGFDPVDAEDGVDALKVLGEVGTVDLMMVDWNMPNMNGLEFVKEVRKDAAHANTKILMVSSEIEMDNIVQALDAGANEYLMKPFTKDTIREKLALLGLVQP
jgi:two-component system, chemotaxis family, chemotaxis protein CheY